MIHQAVSEIWVIRMESTILEHPVFMIKYISVFWLVLRRLLVAKNKKNKTGLTGRSKNLDPTGNLTGRSTRPVSISDLFRRLGELKLKDQVIPKNVAIGRRAK